MDFFVTLLQIIGEAGAQPPPPPPPPPPAIPFGGVWLIAMALALLGWWHSQKARRHR